MLTAVHTRSGTYAYVCTVVPCTRHTSRTMPRPLSRPTAEMAAIAALHIMCALAPWPFSSLDRAVARGNSCTRARGPSGEPRDARIVCAAGIRNAGLARRRLLHDPRVERSQSEKREKSRSIRHREGEVCHVTTRPPLEHARKSPKSRASTGIRIARERAVSGSNL